MNQLDEDILTSEDMEKEADQLAKKKHKKKKSKSKKNKSIKKTLEEKSSSKV